MENKESNVLDIVKSRVLSILPDGANLLYLFVASSDSNVAIGRVSAKSMVVDTHSLLDIISVDFEDSEYTISVKFDNEGNLQFKS